MFSIKSRYKNYTPEKLIIKFSAGPCCSWKVRNCIPNYCWVFFFEGNYCWVIE